MPNVTNIPVGQMLFGEKTWSQSGGCHLPYSIPSKRLKDGKVASGGSVSGRALDYEMEWLKQGSLTEGIGSVRLTSL